jgi:hypothetical protein
MNEGRSQPPVHAFIYSKRDTRLRLDPMALEVAMISSVAELGAFGPSCTTLFVSQVTTDYDLVLTPKGVFGVRGYEGVDPCFLKSR